MKFIVITGGPGAGKTAALEMARIRFGDKITILPEAATILFSGGFPREKEINCMKSSQRCIYYIQKELESLARFSAKSKIVLCDRGTVDGLAYWPGDGEDFWKEVGSSLAAEFKKYKAVIHLQTPTQSNGYNHQNPARIENSLEARIIDQKIRLVWHDHPEVHLVESETDFVRKVEKVLNLIAIEIADVR